jgi:hypothetical protein
VTKGDNIALAGCDRYSSLDVQPPLHSVLTFFFVVACGHMSGVQPPVIYIADPFP